MTFIERLKDKYDANEPIFTEEILKTFRDYSRAFVFRLIKDAENAGELVKFSKGVYYLPRKTFYGVSTITADSVIERKYLRQNDDVFGVYGGLKLLNAFSVTTQVPNVIEVVTNNETTRCREITLDGRRFVLRRSRVKIDKANANAYTVLQLFSDLDRDAELSDFAKRRLRDYLTEKRIPRDQLLSLAMDFPARTLKKLIGSGVLA